MSAAADLRAFVTKDYLGHKKRAKYHELAGHTDSVEQLCWHPTQPDVLATASNDRTMRVWDLRDRANRCKAVVQTRAPNLSIVWNPNPSTPHIVVGSKDDELSFIDTTTMTIFKTHKFNLETNELQFSRNGELLFVASASGAVDVYRYPSMELVHSLGGHTSSCISLDIDAVGRYVAVGAADAVVSLWDAQELACVRTMTALETPVRSVSFSHDGQLLACASEDPVIEIMNSNTGASVHRVRTRGALNAVAWSPSAMVLAYACDDRDYENVVVHMFAQFAAAGGV